MKYKFLTVFFTLTTFVAIAFAIKFFLQLGPLGARSLSAELKIAELEGQMQSAAKKLEDQKIQTQLNLEQERSESVSKMQAFAYQAMLCEKIKKKLNILD